MFGFIEGAAVNGIVNIVLTTLETRFSLPSSQSGLIVSATDIGIFINSIFLFSEHFYWISNSDFRLAITFINLLYSLFSDIVK